MNYRTFSVVLTACVLLLNAGFSTATESNAIAQQEAASAVKAPAKTAKSGKKGTKHKTVAPIKLVDINSAKKEELMKLPGISAAQADQIIAGRPFGSKAWLVSKNIVPGITYQAIKNKIVCTITKADYDKIIANAKANKK
jgi:competence protein ComEA